MRRIYLVALSLCAGCFSNRAAIDPYSYAPKSPSSEWKAVKKVAKPEAIPDEETPLSLAEALDIALRNNPQTKLTWAKARVAAAQYGQAQSGDFPVLGFSFNYSRSRGATTATGGVVAVPTPAAATASTSTTTAPASPFGSQWGPQLVLTYTILDFGETRATTEAARQALFFADFTHNRQIQTILQQVTSDYYNLLYQKQLLEAKEEDLITAETTYEATVIELDAGVKDMSDLLQAQTQYLQAKIAKVSQTQNVQNTTTTLVTNMGLSAYQKIRLQQIPEIPPTHEMLQGADELLAMALEKRADLLAAEANLKSQEANVVVAERQFWPTFDYTLNFGQTSFGASGSDGYDFTSTFSLNFPIFSGFSNYNSVKLAKAQKEEAEATLRQTQLSIIQDVMTAHVNVKASFENVKYADELLRASQKQYDVILAKYKAGTSTILELVSAQSSLADARATQVSNTNQWFNALIQLSYAAGTLEPPELKEAY